MPWVKLEDDFPENPKIARLSDSALALFVVGLAYCNRNLTDGFIPSQVGLGQLRFCEGNTVPVIDELVSAGLWEVVAGGWQIHDFHDYQPTRSAVLAERDAARDRMRSVRANRKGSSAEVLANRTNEPFGGSSGEPQNQAVQPNFDRSSTTPVPVVKASPSFVAEANYEEPASDAKNLNALQSMKERIGREMPQ